jgi:hypothetical protein
VFQSLILAASFACAQIFRRNSSRHHRLTNDFISIAPFGIRFANGLRRECKFTTRTWES